MIDAAAIEKLMPSPLSKGFCGIGSPGTMRASTSTCCGTIGSASTARRMASSPAW
jgi:hypothetical protein